MYLNSEDKKAIFEKYGMILALLSPRLHYFLSVLLI